MTIAYLPMTGQPHSMTLYDWFRRAWVRCTVIDLGVPDPLAPDEPALEREPLPTGNRERIPIGTPRMNTYAADDTADYIADLLAERGPLRLRDIAEATAIPKNTLWYLMERRPGMFRRTGCAEGVRWQLADAP